MAQRFSEFPEAVADAYDAFRKLNRLFFDDALPVPFIRFDITPHGRALGRCFDHGIIQLHQALIGAGKRPADDRVWSLGPRELGRAVTHDVLLHELMHHRMFQLGPPVTAPRRSWHTAHNEPSWIAECQRVGELLGFGNSDRPWRCSLKKPVRVAGRRTDAVDPDCVDYSWLYCFPHFARRHYEGVDCYSRHHVAGSSWLDDFVEAQAVESSSAHTLLSTSPSPTGSASSV